MNEEYDFVVLGTGLVECILSSLLSMKGKKVLHMDKNDYYGGECASLNISQLYKKFRPEMQPPSFLGKDRDYCVDLIPKFMMANEALVEVLVHTDVTRYLEFRQIAGSFVFKDGKVTRVPATPEEVSLKDLFFGPIEMYRIRNFLQFVEGYNEKIPITSQSIGDLSTIPMKKVFDHFSLGSSVREMIGHSLALHIDDSYLEQPAKETISRIRLYKESAFRFGRSPYIYPAYGLSELPQGFARLCAIYGGTYMLNKPFDGAVFDEENKLVGVKSGDEIARCKAIIADPSYFRDRVRRTCKVIRAICILNAPIPQTKQSHSCQIIIPRSQANRKYDIYVACVSSAHNICPKDFYVAIVSTILENEDSKCPESEIKIGLDLLGTIIDKFIYISDVWVPCEDGCRDRVFISKSFDATSHFETMYQDVASIYERIMNEPLTVPKRERADDS